ncbi:hypothetical protein LOTGIDRAFT_197158 [Lottia gigantea]|uniref:acylphosphatase n=1 Tax=Lottia gigantea TaxID=225164 RepID=V3ZM27_LOTGI|nr:hypothetical protein LOTGIDRAFT_197158 [Lottia gigantea]ESO83485.1 hypothetical protein LOTGIDRAFT_197158 [Lottia gigantea]
MAARAKKFLSFDFEIFGKVQGVFFRKHTKKAAENLNLVGWVRNTGHKTVVGVVQGPEEKVIQMREWLSTKGSPNSVIEKSVFHNERYLQKADFNKFEIKRH